MRRKFTRMSLRFVRATMFAVGCAEPEQIGDPPELADLEYHYTTENLQIHTDVERCAGDLARWDGFVEHVETYLDVDMPYVVDLHVWSDANFDGPALCGIDRSGCFRDSRQAIYTAMVAVEHELIHAVTADLGNRDAFFREGVAEALSGSTQFGLYPPTFPAGRSREVDYRSAGHFVRWLLETGGPEPMVDYLSTSGADVDEFEAIYFSDFEQKYFAEAEPSYARVYEHPAPALVRDGAISWSSELIFDCSREDVRRGDPGLVVMRDFEVPEPGYYAFSSSTGGAISIRERARALEHTVHLDGAGIHARWLHAGSHEISVAGEGDEAGATLHVWINEATVPTLPDEAQP
jgi:hypothetical protein